MTRPRVCILTSQFFGWGAYSGFGSMPRKLAGALAAEGVPVTVVTQRRQDQRPVEVIDGATVYSYAGASLRDAYRLIQTIDADIFHSQNPSLLTWLAQRAHPHRVHIVTCRDPHTTMDWVIEFRYATMRRRLLLPMNYVSEASLLVRRSVRRAQGVFVPADCLRPKVRDIFRLKALPGVLPNLTSIPETFPRKAETPTFVFVARWDKRKRPWLFLDLARTFPDYRFIALGQSTALGESGYDRALRRRYANLPNLEAPGLVDQFLDPVRFSQILSEAWVLVNTAAREGLPLTFLEAAAHGCALLSGMDPDQWVSQFGVRVSGDDFASGLRALMGASPLGKGRAAYEHLKRGPYEWTRALAEHIRVYEQLM